jgi:hypothetical protein
MDLSRYRQLMKNMSGAVRNPAQATNAQQK